MSTQVGFWVYTGTSIKRRGHTDRLPGGALPPAPDPTFTLGTTMPVPGINAGIDNSVTLTPYTGTGAGSVFTVSVPTTFTNIDFGTTRVKRATNGLHFSNCRFTQTTTGDVKHDFGPTIDCRNDFTDTQINRCSFTNLSQWAPTCVAVGGSGYTMTRCTVRGYSDGLGSYVPAARPNTALGVSLLGCWIGELGWYWAPTSGLVHPSDTKTHNDLMQTQGGQGLHVEGCVLDAHYSTTVGTGTPNSGNDTTGAGASLAPYTQAQGEASRLSIVDGGGTFADGQPGAHLGGSISALMFNSARGATPAASILSNWGGGGSDWLNAGDTGLSGDFGTITGNRIDNNQRNKGYAFGLRSVMTAVVSGNTWTDGSGTISRKNA